jgi:predicted nucleic acid-binding protein
VIVLDTSLVGPLIIPDERSPSTELLEAALLDTAILVPAHWHLEVASMIQVAIRRGRIAEQDRPQILADIAALSPRVDPGTWEVAWHDTLVLADRHGLTPYDAAYLELAIRAAATLGTLDRALAKAARAEHVDLLATGP